MPELYSDPVVEGAPVPGAPIGRRLAGKTAIVAGAAQGLGAAIARLFASEGAGVLVTDVNAQAGEAVVAWITDNGGRAAWQPLDVTSAEAWDEAIVRCVATVGEPNVLVLSVRSPVGGTLLECSPEDWDQLMAVQLRGCMLGMRAVVPVMRRLGHGSIVAIGASRGGQLASGAGTAYQASKAGLTALTKSVAAEYGRDGIRANIVHPGPMRTESLAASGAAAEIEELASRFPLPRIAEPIEVAQAALFLASDESSYITASTIVPDGGSSSVFLS
jgi:NAD(P)-dependent dehydrogenase (short-subunit alcohol dehydrogenase family)